MAVAIVRMSAIVRFCLLRCIAVIRFGMKTAARKRTMATGMAILKNLLTSGNVGAAGDRRRDAAHALLLGLATSAVVLWQNRRVIVLWDVSYILENATRIAAGDVPYRDFPIPYAPLTFLIQAAIIRIFGRHYALHIAYAAIVAGVATALTYVIVRLLGTRRSIAVLLCLPLTILGIYCIFPHPFYDPDCCVAVLIALMLFLTERGFAFGVAAVVPLFVKQNIGLPCLIAAVAVLLFTRNGKALAGVL